MEQYFAGANSKTVSVLYGTQKEIFVRQFFYFQNLLDFPERIGYYMYVLPWEISRSTNLNSTSISSCKYRISFSILNPHELIVYFQVASTVPVCQLGSY